MTKNNACGNWFKHCRNVNSEQQNIVSGHGFSNNNSVYTA